MYLHNLLDIFAEKKSSVKKKPDFAKMHEIMFARSESLVDAKKRLEDRHITFSNNVYYC